MQALLLSMVSMEQAGSVSNVDRHWGQNVRLFVRSGLE